MGWNYALYLQIFLNGFRNLNVLTSRIFTVFKEELHINKGKEESRAAEQFRREGRGGGGGEGGTLNASTRIGVGGEGLGDAMNIFILVMN